MVLIGDALDSGESRNDGKLNHLNCNATLRVSGELRMTCYDAENTEGVAR